MLLFDRAVTRTFQMSPNLVSFVFSGIVLLPSEMVVKIAGGPGNRFVLVVRQVAIDPIPHIVGKENPGACHGRVILIVVSVSLGNEEIKTLVTLIEALNSRRYRGADRPLRRRGQWELR